MSFYVPAQVDDLDPMYVGTYSRNGVQGHYKGVTASAPSSGTYASADRVHYVPFHISRGYPLARWWVGNGATVGTNYWEVGIYDENLDLRWASPRTLSAGTVNHLQYATPGIHGTNVTLGNDTTDTNLYTTASVTLKAGVLYLMSVENSKAASADAVSSIDSATGGYPTFTSRSTTQYEGAIKRISIWSAVPTADFTGTLRINFPASATGCLWSLNAFFHVDTATTDGVVQNAVGTGSSVTPLATLAAFGSANNATFGAVGLAVGGNGTPSTGYLELSDQVIATPTQGLITAYRPDNDTTFDYTITSGAWGACAVEIKSRGTGAIQLPPMRGYLAIHCNGTTATFFRASAVDYLRPVQYQQASTTGLPPSATPVAGAGTVYNFGFTRRATP